MDTTDAAGCDSVPLWSERIFVALPDLHPLCGKAEIEWTDLRNEHLILRQCERDPALCDRLTKRLTDRNHDANVQKLNVGREALMNLVAMGLGLGLTSEATIATRFSKVVFRPIAGDDELLQFSAAWLSHNDNPALRRFLSLAPQHRERPAAACWFRIRADLARITRNQRHQPIRCFSRRARKKARSVDMKRANIGAMSFAGSTF
jgi:DNA-binding transcriptional LysR family regulator